VNYSPISIAIDGLGLNVTGFSYNGTMWICAVSCREMMPDPAVFAECLRESFADLKVAAERFAAENEAARSAGEQAERRKTARRRKAPVRKKATRARRKRAAAATPEG
jgi:hypothetical protein